MVIIDAHSHIGQDYLFGKSDLKDYIEFCKRNKIQYGTLMPQPNACYCINGKLTPCLVWNYQSNKIEYSTYNEKNENPYKYLNYYLYRQCKDENEININFIPIIHPVLDTPEYIEELITHIEPVAIKIHGIGSGVIPSNISSQLITILKKYQLPIIVHTEYDSRERTNYNEGKKYIKESNHPRLWAKFLIDNGIKGILTHGVGLDYETIEMIKGNKNILVGLGPDFLLEHQGYRLSDLKGKRSYLETLKNEMPVDQIVFDVDYNWNKGSTNDELDEGTIERVKKVWTSEEEQEKIFGINIAKFYGIDLERPRREDEVR